MSNVLTPAQIERLALLIEEAAEVQQAATKILRHGYDSRHPYTKEINIDGLTRELGDLQFSILLMTVKGDININEVNGNCELKKSRAQRYLHHNKIDW